MIKYSAPDNWIKYDISEIAEELISAITSVKSLQTTPFQRGWIDGLQKLELKREVVGTSRIEGADFTEQELEVALSESTEELHTRSQRQVSSAMKAYKWIAKIPDDSSLTENTILEIHKRIVYRADDDHCRPGEIRQQDENVHFGNPRHRGADGGKECKEVFKLFVNALQSEYGNHPPLVQAIAAHYHLAAMHPFLDGNGRTARAFEALLLQRAGLKDYCFIAMSNYYYDEKYNYLDLLADVRAKGHDLTSFLKFCLKGIALQVNRVLGGIKKEIQRALYRNMMHDLFGRLKTSRKRVIAARQMKILELLLQHDTILLEELIVMIDANYQMLKHPNTAIGTDLRDLLNLDAITYSHTADGKVLLRINLDWPTQITETEFFEKIKTMPKAKDFPF